MHLVMELCVGEEFFHRFEKYKKFSESEARILFRHLDFSQVEATTGCLSNPHVAMNQVQGRIPCSS